jgi:carbon-monoxide dehydrogenase medium subunit
VKPAPFHYHDPASLDEALALLQELPRSMPLAGGQTLMPALNARTVTADHLVDLDRVPGLDGIERPNGALRLGAMVRQRDAERSPDVAAACSLVGAALQYVGHRATRNRGTIGGSLAELVPGAELPAVAAVHDAVVHIAGGDDGHRGMSFAEFCLAGGRRGMRRGELVAGVTLTPWAVPHGAAFVEASPRLGSAATVGVAALVALHGRDGSVARAAIAIAGLDRRPLRATAAEESLVGFPATAPRLEAAAETVDWLPASSEIRASERHRRRLARVMVQRAVLAAVADAEAVAA